jgi:tyrosyl-tRNA synthetase
LPDSLVEPFLRQFTFLNEDKIESVMQKRLRSNDPYVAHRLLAEQITLLVHGADALRVAQLATKILYEKDVNAVGQLTHDDLERIFDSSQITELILDPEETTVTDLAVKCKAFLHSIDAVRAIQQGGFSINQIKVTDPSCLINDSHILPNHTTLVKVGKKRFHLIKWR